MTRAKVTERELAAARALLVERYVQGMGMEIAAHLGVAADTVSRFKRGGRFPNEKLEELLGFLATKDLAPPQQPVRELLVACLSQRVVHAADIARRFDVNKATVSRFKDGRLSFPAEKLDALASYLHEQGRRAGKSLSNGPSERAPSMLIGHPTVESRAVARAHAVAPALSLREVLVQLATAFAGRLVEAALAELRGARTRSNRRPLPARAPSSMGSAPRVFAGKQLDEKKDRGRDAQDQRGVSERGPRGQDAE